MLSILDTFSKRMLSLLRLLSETNDWVTIKEIAEQLNVSEKTINDDLKVITRDFSDKINIELSFSKQVKVGDFPVNTFLEIQSIILAESVSIKFLIELLKHPFHDLNYYSNRIHISRSTLYRQLPTINHFFTTYGIHIESKHSLYSIYTNDEYKCRRFFTTFLFEVFKYKISLFIDNESLFFYRHRIQYIYSQNNEPISDVQLFYYSVYYHVSILREHQKNPLPNTYSSLGKRIPFTDKQLEFLHKNQLSDQTLLDIEASIYIHRHTLFSKTDDLFILETTYLINKIYSVFTLENNESEKNSLIDFLIDLCINVKYFQIPYHFFYDRFSPFTQQIKNDHKTVYDLLVRLIDDYSLQINLDLSLYTNHLIYLFISSLPSLLASRTNHLFLIVSNYSRDHSRFMSSIIQKQLTNNPIYINENACIQLEEIDQYDLSLFQLIISNTEIKTDGTPCMLINDFPNKKDITDIQQFLLANSIVDSHVS